MKDAIERGRAVALMCQGCGEALIILPPMMPKKVETMLPMLMGAMGVPMKARTLDGTTDAPTMFGLTGEELSKLLAPKCASCAHADPLYRAELAHAVLRVVTDGGDALAVIGSDLQGETSL